MQFFFFEGFPKLDKMTNVAVVKHFPGDPRFTISFHLKLQQNKIDKQFNANRDLKEETTAFLERLNNNVNKVNKAKDSKLTLNFVTSNESVIEESDTVKTVNDFIFNNGLKMIIKDVKSSHEVVYSIKVNSPLVRECKMSDSIMSGMLVYPSSLILDFADETKTIFEWFHSQTLTDEQTQPSSKKVKFDPSKLELSWTKFGEGFTVVPDLSHINCLVKCRYSRHFL